MEWMELIPKLAAPISALYAVYTWVRNNDPIAVLLIGRHPRLTICVDNVRRVSGSNPHVTCQLVVLCASVDQIPYDTAYPTKLCIECEGNFICKLLAIDGVTTPSSPPQPEVLITVQREINIDTPLVMGLSIEDGSARRFRPLHKLPITVKVIGGPVQRDFLTYGLPTGFLRPFYFASIVAFIGLIMLVFLIAISLAVTFPSSDIIQYTTSGIAFIGSMAITIIPHLARRVQRAERSLHYLESHDV